MRMSQCECERIVCARNREQCMFVCMSHSTPNQIPSSGIYMQHRSSKSGSITQSPKQQRNYPILCASPIDKEQDTNYADDRHMDMAQCVYIILLEETRRTRARSEMGVRRMDVNMKRAHTVMARQQVSILSTTYKNVFCYFEICNVDILTHCNISMLCIITF